MERFKGYIEKIVYTNPDNGYTVIELEMDGDSLTCVGTIPYVNEGEFVEVAGDFIEHSVYGRQLKVATCEELPPEDEKSVERYLGSGAIKGIGAALAARIVKMFKGDTLRIIEQEPERLAQVKGISERMAAEISDNVVSKREMRNAMIFLQGYGISMALAAKIYNQYGSGLYSVLKENPYRLAEDIEGVGFKIADDIAVKSGISADSDYRIKCGVLYVLSEAMGNGNIYLPYDELLYETRVLLDIMTDDIRQQLLEMSIEKKIVMKESEGVTIIYSAPCFYAEMSVSYALKALNTVYKTDTAEVDKKIDSIQKYERIELEEHQRDAVRQAAQSGVLVVTGGPGTGKTTTINTIIRYFEREGLEIKLAAPTGRAAKRMSEATSREAQTIHRLLEIMGASDGDKPAAGFLKNEENPIEADVVIIDEMSMVDIFLMNSLLKAIVPGTRLVLVGDINQLPSVGPGNVLRDIISSDCFKVVRLTKIFRQSEQSDIIVNAHKINAGEHFEIGPSSKDFIYLKRDEPANVMGAMVTLVSDKLPRYVNAKPFDIQVLTPTRKGSLGVDNLNKVLQGYLNPASADKQEHEDGGRIFREGDKVMQIKNNYQLAWEVRGLRGIVAEQGMGVFNGDMGIVDNINKFMELVTVRFDDERYVQYTFKQLEELELAYAVTVHKSQGSEYPAVVMPMLNGPKMLMNRNILYTGVTRAKKCVCIVGAKEVFYEMVDNENEQRRYSTLAKRIQECFGAALST